ncbi:MAG: hypothetical protein ACHQZQ_09415 [SAR324 cluster bacterium]
MISVKVDPVRQRIDLVADQEVGEADMQRILAEVTAGVRLMRPGWIMTNDFRGQALISPKLDPYIAAVQKAVLAGAPRKIATLVDSQLLKMQLSVSSVATRSGDLTQRFDNEQAWRAFIEAP